MGLAIPLGAKVDYLPSDTFAMEKYKFEGRHRVGVFMGYVLSSGANWSKRTYRVVDLSDFLTCNLHRRATVEHVKVHIQEVSTIVNWDEDAEPIFPLRDQYDWFNSTFYGNITALAMDPGFFYTKNGPRVDCRTIQVSQRKTHMKVRRTKDGRGGKPRCLQRRSESIMSRMTSQSF